MADTVEEEKSAENKSRKIPVKNGVIPKKIFLIMYSPKQMTLDNFIILHTGWKCYVILRNNMLEWERMQGG